MLFRRFITMAWAIIMLATGLPVRASEPLTDQLTDSLVRDHRLIFFGEGRQAHPDSIVSLIYNFYHDQFRHFQDPAAPYFLFMSKGADLAMGVGGCVRMRGYFDWGGALPASGFSPILIPMTKNPLRDKHFGTTPAGTALFFRIIGRNKSLGDYQLYIEANFNGYESRDFHLKKAYAQINDWTIGYANSTFSDPAALPPVIDASGPNIKMSATAVLVRWLHSIGHGFSVAASVETPDMAPVGGSAQQIEGVRARSQYVPNVAAFVQYRWGQSQHVRLSALMRQLPYRDMLLHTDHNITGLGVMLTTTFHPAPQLTVYGNFTAGKGIAGMGGDLLIGNYDLVADPSRPGRAYAPSSVGYYAALQYNFRPDLLVSATVGQARLLPGQAVDPSEYKYGIYVSANVLWNLTPRIQAGAEFNWGRRCNFSGEHGDARRLGALASFSF